MKRILFAVGRFFDKHPLFSFGVALFLLLDAILIGNFLRKPTVGADVAIDMPKQVEVFVLGTSPTVGLGGEVERDGVVTVVAQTPGIVQSIYVKEGSVVGVGQQIAFISTSYSGENISDLSREIADKSALNTQTDLQNQLEILSLQRRSAEKNAADAGVSGGSVLDLQREAAVRQTESGALGLRLASEISGLNLAIASVSAQLGRPVSPLFGIVDRIFVKRGDALAPGAPIAVLSAKNTTSTVRVFVSANMAKRLDKKKKATTVVGDKIVDLVIRSISTQPTDGNLYSVVLDIPRQSATTWNHKERIFVSLPIMVPSGSNGLFLPLDAVYQTQSGAFVFVVDDHEGKKVAVSRPVQLGEVVGSFVVVEDGMSSSDVVILSRTVVNGDLVEVR